MNIKKVQSNCPLFPAKTTGTFPEGGDSGSIIVSPLGEFISLLTGWTNKGTGGSDTTYSTLFTVRVNVEAVLAEFLMQACPGMRFRSS